MLDSFKPLYHQDDTDEDTRKHEARSHLLTWPHVQVIAELVSTLRALNVPWWSPSYMREEWRPLARMQWFRPRVDIRQRVTTSLTGFSKNAARSKAPEFQATLIDAALEHGDITDKQFDDAFTAEEIAAYGPADEIWTQFRARMPWEEDSPVHQKLVGWLLRTLMSDRSSTDSEMTRRPILTAWDVRTAIDARVWQERMPLDVRAGIDEARLKHEKSRPREPFHARHELAIATPEIIAQNIPLIDLVPVIQAAEHGLLWSSEQSAQRQSGSFELGSTGPRSTATDLPAISTRPFALAR